MATKAMKKTDSKQPKKTSTAKRAVKQASRVRKEAAKSTLRPTKKKGVGANDAKKNLKEKVSGHAPSSTRITTPKGPVQSLAAQTKFFPKSEERQWLLVDAKNKTVGRLATQIAVLLRGKHKRNFTPNNDVGDFVVVVNAKDIKFSGDKMNSKMYHHHSGYIGGLKTSSAKDVLESFPERILFRAVKGMVPRTPLGRDQMRKLKIYADENHPHAAQAPVVWNSRS